MRCITRWHTVSPMRSQSVLEHSASVALLAVYLAPADMGNLDLLQLEHLALHHDAHEAVYGDVPYPAKQALAREGFDIDAISARKFWGDEDPWQHAEPHLRLIVEVADVLDAALYAQEFIPERAAVIVAQAIDIAKGLSNEGFLKVLTALGRLEPEGGAL